MITTISKGQQVTIPAQFRKALHLTVGSRVEIEKKGKTLVIKPIDGDLKTLFREAKTVAPKRRLSAKQMDELIEHEVH